MAGIDMERKELVYSKTSKRNITLNLYAKNGTKDYSDYTDRNGNELIKNDKLFLLEIVDSEGNASALYPFYTYDIGICAYQIIKNKIIRGAKENEANKIINRIKDALNE